MKIHKTYGYGQLFAFSGLDGETSYKDDFVGVLMHEPISIRFHFENAITFSLPVKKDVDLKAITGDVIEGEGFLIVFESKYTIVGKSLVKPVITTEMYANRSIIDNILVIKTEDGDFFYNEKIIDGWYHFAFSYKDANVKIFENERLDRLKQERYDYFDNKPKCKDEAFEELYYKCLSVNKVNVYSKEGKINCRWTTPDRVPHHHMWLWDSAFHAMAFSEYDLNMAKDCIRSVLHVQDKNGFIAHMLTPKGAISNLTQPQVIAWASWVVYQKDKDIDFLKECAEGIKKYLLWTKENRDNNSNGLLEWLVEPDYTECKCGESGLDNSPRFDFDIPMDAIDFSSYLCNDAKYMSLIYTEIGDEKNSRAFLELHNTIKDKINDLLWYEEGGYYCDRTFDGQLTKVVTTSSFLPMAIGIASKERVEKMAKVILDEERFWTEMPLPSIAKNSEVYTGDMWRGGVWVNINYFIILGLRKYGYFEIATQLRLKTLNAIKKVYEQTGNIFEFYDAEDKVVPFKLDRKGAQPKVPDYRVHVHSITDFNWTACFVMMLIQQIWN